MRGLLLVEAFESQVLVVHLVVGTPRGVEMLCLELMEMDWKKLGCCHRGSLV